MCGRLAWAPRDGSCARQEARGRIGFRAVREGRVGSLPTRATDPSRCRPGVVDMGIEGGDSLTPDAAPTHDVADSRKRWDSIKNRSKSLQRSVLSTSPNPLQMGGQPVAATVGPVRRETGASRSAGF